MEGCKRVIIDSWWRFCGETDMGQGPPVLCVECGAVYDERQKRTGSSFSLAQYYELKKTLDK